MEPLLDTKSAAPLVGLAAGTLENLRIRGTGPKFIKAGKRVMYDPADLRAWRDANRFSSTSEAA